MKEITRIDSRNIKGGCITARDKALLPFGASSYMQNLRNRYDGLEQRRGQRIQHSTPDSTNKVLNLYQFAKTQVSEKHTYAQMSDGDVLEASNLPPIVTTGPFGPEVYSGTAGNIAGSFATIQDLMLYANGIDPHQIYGGTSSPIDRIIVFRGAATIPDIPQGGEDYSDQVIAAGDGTVAVLDSLPTYAAYGCIFIKTDVPAKSFTFKVYKPNGNTATTAVYYRKSDATWAAAAGVSDGTASSGKTFAVDGTISFTPPTDMIPKYLFGIMGFWYQLRVSATLDSEVEISQITYSSNFSPLANVWDSNPVYGVEVLVEGVSTWESWGAASVNLSELTAGKKVRIAFTDPVEGIYADPGGTPNATGTTISSIKYWSGSAWTTVGTITDGSAGLTQAGWITFPRCPAQALQLNTTVYQAYWYEIIFSATLLADTNASFQGMPYFDITEIGNGYTNCVWKDRAFLTCDRWGAYIYASAKDAPMALNGLDFGILKAGDGRANRVVGMRTFHNELLVWQEERGVEGGCITLFEGYSPVTFGKLVISTRIGAMNNKSMCVVDGVMTSTKTTEAIKTLAFSLSRFGVCACDGQTVSFISDDIANYFDPTDPACIRYGYEQEMWLVHDPVYNVLRLGLVSGATATTCNVFPVFDLVTKTWSFDDLGQKLAVICAIEPGSGQAPIIAIGGGVNDGTVYELNYGLNDITLPVVSRCDLVLNHKARVIQLIELVLRFLAQPYGYASVAIYQGGTRKFTKRLDMMPERAGDTSRRHRFTCDATGDVMVAEISCAGISESMFIFDLGMDVRLWENK